MEESDQRPALQTYLSLIKRRFWILLLPALVLPVFAYRQAGSVAPYYVATSDVLLSADNVAATVTGVGVNWSDPVRDGRTQAQIAGTTEVATLALNLAKLPDKTPEQLLKATTITPDPASDILSFTVRDADSRLAHTLSAAYATSYVTYRTSLDVGAINKARADIASQIGQLGEAEQNATLIGDLRAKDQQLAIVETLRSNRARVIRSAQSSDEIGPKPIRSAVLGGVLGLMLGSALVLAAEALDTRLRSPAQAADFLGLRLLTRLPDLSRLARRRGVDMLVAPTGPSAEAFRTLCTTLEIGGVGREHRTLLVTSANEQEGKSTVAANLAVAFARRGLVVVLADLDLRRPTQDVLFSIPAVPGISDVANGTATLSTASVPIDFDVAAPAHASAEQSRRLVRPGTLRVLTTGTLPTDPSEFISAMRPVHAIGGTNFTGDLIIIDSPPLLAVADSLALAAQADAVLLVADVRKTRRPQLRELRRVIDGIATPKVGLVTTSSGTDPDAGSYGSYGYGYTANPAPTRFRRIRADRA